MSEECECPICGGHIEIDINSHKGTTIDLWLKNREDNHNMLLEALKDYWRWKAEGEKKFDVNCEKGTQLFYDGYHNHINYLPEEDAYEFRIQTYDSPEGDTWWKGKFKYNVWVGEGSERHHEQIHIVESDSGWR